MKSPNQLLALITTKWFANNGIVDPELAFQRWKAWITEKPSRKSNFQVMLNKVLELATDLSDTSVRFYRHKNPTMRKKIGERNAQILDSMMIALDQPLPERTRKVIQNQNNHIAILTDFSNLPSLYYHRIVIAGIMGAAEQHNYMVTIHEISSQGLDKTIHKVVLAYRPSGFIIIRHAPQKKALAYLKNESIPTMLINANRGSYQYPLVGNIISLLQGPKNPELELELRAWLRAVPLKKKKSTDRKVVLAHMPTKDQHRGRRVNFISWVAQSESFQVIPYELQNYRAYNSFHIWDKHRDVDAYILLSDQLGIAMIQILRAAGQRYKQRVLGFDDSPISKKEKIASFNQSLCSVGSMAVERLLEVLRGKDQRYREIEIKVRLRK